MATWDRLAEAGYVFRRWDESNCAFDECGFAKNAFREKKWGFIGDYYRLKALYTEGGIYLDTDVIVNATFDDLLDQKAFIGFFVNTELCTAAVGAEKGSRFIKKLLDMYETGSYETPDTVIHGRDYKDLYQKEYRCPSNEPWTWCIIKNYPKFRLNNKKQMLDDVTVYPKEYFETGAITGRWYTAHLTLGSWTDRNENKQGLLSVLKNKNAMKINLIKMNQKLFSLIRKIKFRKIQKSNSFYQYRNKIGT